MEDENMKDLNMKFWNKVCKTNPAETKTVDYPFKHTSISAQFQIKHATEQWGIMGGKWGVKDEKFMPIFYATDEVGLLLYTATLFHPFGQIPIHADINFYMKTKNGIKVDNDISKKVATDALTKGLSKLGFNSDVFEGLFDDNKYVQRMKYEFSKQENKSIADNINNCTSLIELRAVFESLSVDEKKAYEDLKNKKKEELNG